MQSIRWGKLNSKIEERKRCADIPKHNHCYYATVTSVITHHGVTNPEDHNMNFYAVITIELISFYSYVYIHNFLSTGFIIIISIIIIIIIIIIKTASGV
jgi:hypothetical protein